MVGKTIWQGLVLTRRMAPILKDPRESISIPCRQKGADTLNEDSEIVCSMHRASEKAGATGRHFAWATSTPQTEHAVEPPDPLCSGY
jgi:hypothetical protein